MLRSCVCLFGVQKPSKSDLRLFADVTSVQRAGRHQSALKVAGGDDAVPSRVTADYRRNDHLRFSYSGSEHINTSRTINALYFWLRPQPRI